MIQSLEGMDLADRLREMSSRIRQRVENVKTEEATKTALVMPFINHVLGYNVFDPAEVVPEFIADVGTKKGEKVDYAIFRNGDPIMLFECKHYGVDLGKEPASQLYRYFSVAKARFGVLTDGVIYRFYSELLAKNRNRPGFPYQKPWGCGALQISGQRQAVALYNSRGRQLLTVGSQEQSTTIKQ